MSVQRAGEAGLLPSAGGGYDAERALELGRRPFVDYGHLVAAFEPGSILLVQQAPVHWVTVDDEVNSWRVAWGYLDSLSDGDKVRAASGWWPVEEGRRAGVRGIVATVASFVVTLAVVDAADPVAGLHLNKVRLNASPATDETPMGARLRTHFLGRRHPIRAGSSFLIP